MVLLCMRNCESAAHVYVRHLRLPR